MSSLPENLENLNEDGKCEMDAIQRPLATTGGRMENMADAVRALDGVGSYGISQVSMLLTRSNLSSGYIFHSM